MILKVNSELLQVINLFRHGARGPIYEYYDWESQKEIMGQLTPGGMRQHFELGRALRKEYIEKQQFLSPKFNHTELKIFSTNVNRTIQSAQCQLLGLYPLGSGPDLLDVSEQLTIPPFKGATNVQQLEQKEALPLHYQPFPIHTVMVEDLFLSNICPNQDLFSQSNIRQNQELYNQMQTRFKPLMKKYSDVLTKYSGKTVSIKNTGDLWDIYDNFMSNKFQERDLPQEVTDEDYKQLQMVMSFEWLLKYGTGEYNKIATTEFFNYVVNEFDTKIAKTNNFKYIMLSAHDTNIVKALAALKLTNIDCIIRKFDRKLKQDEQCVDIPTYASQLIFELHQEDSKHYVKLKYQGEYVKICGGKEKCLLSDFKAEVKSLAVQDPHIKCGFVEVLTPEEQEKYHKEKNKQKSDKNYFTIIIIFEFIVAIIFAILVYYKQKQVKELQLESQNEKKEFQN